MESADTQQARRSQGTVRHSRVQLAGEVALIPAVVVVPAGHATHVSTGLVVLPPADQKPVGQTGQLKPPPVPGGQIVKSAGGSKGGTPGGLIGVRNALQACS